MCTVFYVSENVRNDDRLRVVFLDTSVINGLPTSYPTTQYPNLPALLRPKLHPLLRILIILLLLHNHNFLHPIYRRTYFSSLPSYNRVISKKH